MKKIILLFCIFSILNTNLLISKEVLTIDVCATKENLSIPEALKVIKYTLNKYHTDITVRIKVKSKNGKLKVTYEIWDIPISVKITNEIMQQIKKGTP